MSDKTLTLEELRSTIAYMFNGVACRHCSVITGEACYFCDVDDCPKADKIIEMIAPLLAKLAAKDEEIERLKKRISEINNSIARSLK